MSLPARLELHGARTGNCLRVAVALEEAGLAYEPIVLDLQQGDHRSARHLALDPSGRVPVLVDRSRDPPLVLTQSNAIMFHVADGVPGRLLPRQPTLETVAVERFFYFVTDVIAPSHAAFFLRARGEDAAAADALDRRALDALESAERFVAEAAFMAGDAFTLADIAAVTIALAMADRLDETRSPGICRWLDTTRNRRAVRVGMTAFDICGKV